jgi:heptosyltransferase III
VADSGRDQGEGAVLVFFIGSLGDTVIALPAFHELRRRHRDARVVLLTNTPVDGGLKAASSVQILDGSGLVDEFIEYPHGSASPTALTKVIACVRRAGPKLGVYLMRRRTRAQLLRDRVFFRACGVRTMIGLDSGSVEHRPPRGDGPLWESEASRMLRCIGVDCPTLRLEDFSLQLSPVEQRAADDILRRGGVTQPFLAASVGTKVTVKDWGESRWADFLTRLAGASPSMALVLVGSADEAERSARLARDWPWKTANLCGQLTPRHSAAVLARARLFVGHDSGPMHLAAAVGTTTIAVFSAREMPGIWFPFGQEDKVFYRSVPCRGCRLDECIEYQKRCIEQIEPADVAGRALAQLVTQPNRLPGT